MLVSFAEHTLETRSWDSREEMAEALAGCEAGHRLFVPEGDEPVVYSGVIIRLGGSTRFRYGIGVCSLANGLQPNLLLQPERELLVLGFDWQVVGIAVSSRELVFAAQLPHLFYSFLPLTEPPLLLSFHQSGVVAFTPDGAPVWSFTGDALVDTRVEGDLLHLEFMDSPAAAINLATGGVVQSPAAE